MRSTRRKQRGGQEDEEIQINPNNPEETPVPQKPANTPYIPPGTPPPGNEQPFEMPKTDTNSMNSSLPRETERWFATASSPKSTGMANGSLPPEVMGRMMQAAMKSAFSSGMSSEDINAYGEPVAPVTRKLKTFAARLKARKSNATGATGPVTYDKDLLVDQLFVLNNAIQPLRNIVKEADTLMDMIQQGTSDFIKGNQEQTQKLLNSRIKKKIGNLTRKKGKGKKVKLQNLEKMI